MPKIMAYKPDNFIGLPLGIAEKDLIPLAGMTGIITAVFTDKNKVTRLVEEIKSKKLGISVVLSGLFSDVIGRIFGMNIYCVTKLIDKKFRPGKLNLTIAFLGLIPGITALILLILVRVLKVFD